MSESPLTSTARRRIFVADMKAAGLAAYCYRGRWFYEGPAVNVDNLQDALGATGIPCQWDNMGKGWVVYPKDHDDRD